VLVKRPESTEIPLNPSGSRFTQRLYDLDKPLAGWASLTDQTRKNSIDPIEKIENCPIAIALRVALGAMLFRQC
jgi:hypothetical protein